MIAIYKHKANLSLLSYDRTRPARYRERERELLKDELILPVLQLLTVDTHSTLIALGNTHLVWATLHLLTGVFSGIYICKRRGDHVIHNSNHCLVQTGCRESTIISEIILGYRERVVKCRRTNKKK